MARKGHIAKRETLADPMYNSVLVSKLVNQIMLDGKKGVAQKIVYNAFAKVEAKSGKPAGSRFPHRQKASEEDPDKGHQRTRRDSHGRGS